jgi:hypothetical protein
LCTAGGGQKKKSGEEGRQSHKEFEIRRGVQIEVTQSMC